MKHFLLLTLSLLLTLPLQAQTFDGDWHGMMDLGVGELTIELSIDGEKVVLLSPDQSDKPIEGKILYMSTDSLSVLFKDIVAAYLAKAEGDSLVGIFRQSGKPFTLNMTRGRQQRNRPQTPQPPFPYSTEEVSFTNSEGHATLTGTLTLPAMSRRQQKKGVPVVLMVSGSGLQNRDEELFGHRPFAVIADYLARHGIASLRYDDRSVGQSTGDVSKATTEDFMKDAAAGIDFLRRQHRFSKVGVVGHSEGGTIAFMLGSRQLPDFIVSLAGTGIKGDSLILRQTRDLMALNGNSQQLSDEQIMASGRMNANAWMSYFLDFDPRPDIEATRCPVFALNGDKDIQVNVEINLGNIRRLLPANKSNKFKVYDGLNHLFQHATTGSPSEYGRIEQTIAPEVLADIAEWIGGLR